MCGKPARTACLGRNDDHTIDFGCHIGGYRACVRAVDAGGGKTLITWTCTFRSDKPEVGKAAVCGLYETIGAYVKETTEATAAPVPVSVPFLFSASLDFPLFFPFL